MPTYAVGDIQGCYDEFEALLRRIDFDPAQDRLWLVGDLVNRGPRSLEVLRRVRDLGPAAVTVLGNHDLHLLARYYTGQRPRRGDTLEAVLEAPDAAVLCEWLRSMPMLVEDEALGYVMTHAGIPHLWDLDQARALAHEIETVLRGEDYFEFLTEMYGNEPDRWDAGLDGAERWRCVTNYFTRMRLVDDAGRLNLTSKGGLDDAPSGSWPWYELRVRNPLTPRIVFGHWAALEGITDRPDVVGLDTGCVWGGRLTAMCLESRKFASIHAA